jgi:serine/threonine protein phosphatase PrpC
MELRWGAATDPGRVRPGNEDSVLALAKVFAVADGMGGHAAGEVASAVALQTVAARMGERPTSIASVTDVVRAANEAVYLRSLAEPTTRGMGTTLALVAPTTGSDGTDHLVVANVGDSRVYLCADGELRQLTRDHSYVEEMLAAGQITADEARRHPHRHVVTRVVGIEPSVAVDTWLVTPEPRDRYLICSDGLVDEVPDEDIARIITNAPDPQSAADALVVAANEAGGRDNITVIVVEILASDGHRGPDDAIATTAGAAAPTEQLGGWLPHDLAHGFDDVDAPPGDGTPPAPSTASSSAVATATRKGPRRRLVTGRTILFTSLVLGVFVVAFAVIAAFGRHGYYVGFQDDAVVVFQGRPDGVLWFKPTVEAVSEVTRSDLTPEFQSRIADHPTFTSSAAARIYVEQLAENERALVADTTTTTITATTSATATTAATSVVTAAP